MKYKWSFLGEIFNLRDWYCKHDWAVSHAQLPTAVLMDEEIGDVRVFFAARDQNNRSRISYFDYSLATRRVVGFSPEPILDLGGIGHFDQHGVYPASVIYHNGLYHLFYIGWTSAEPKPLFYAAIGCATSKDLNHFKKISKAPILDRSNYDPCLVTSPHVFKDSDQYYMSYVSGDEWFDKNGTLASRYNIKLATSNNLLNWSRSGQVLIDYHGNETNIARPCVLKIGSGFSMWYSYVEDGKKYRMGYAESTNLKDWTRMDYLIKEFPSVRSLNDEMSCYPSVIRWNDSLYMFFNGNFYGRSGVLLAVSDLCHT